MKGIVFLALLCSLSAYAAPLPPELHSINSKTSLAQKIVSFFQKTEEKKINVHIIDALTTQPIQNTYIVLGENGNNPSFSITAYTDENGNASFEYNSSSNADITAAKLGYTAYTVFNIEKGDLTISLQPLNIPTKKVQLTGKFTGWPRMKDGDDRLHVGLIMPFIKLQQLLDFNFTSLLGPPTKGIAYEERDIPGNLVLPKQREYFLKVWPVDFKHPTYTLNLKKNATHNLASLIGELPFSTVGKTFMNGGSLEKTLNVVKFTKLNLQTNFFADHDTKFNIPLDQDIKSNLTVNIHNEPKNRGIIAVSAGNLDGKAREFFPMSFKMIAKNRTPKTAKLATTHIPDSTNFVVAIAADLPERTDEKREFDKAASGIIRHDTHQHSWGGNLKLNSFFKLIDQTASEDLSHFEFTDPTNPKISPAPMMAISHLNYIVKSKKEMTPSSVTRIWTMITPIHQRQFSLPELPFSRELLPDPKATPEKDKLTWEVSVYAFEEANPFFFNYHNIDEASFRKYVSHFSRNSLVLKE